MRKSAILMRNMSNARMALAVAAALLVPVSAPRAAFANDSVAHLATGGLVLSRTDAIEMRSEDLFVSTREIRVHYRFFNRTDRDVTTLVAFPLPDITAPSDENNFVIPEPDQTTNFVGFRTTVDAKPVAMRVEQRATALGVDRTDLLKSLSLPIAPHAASLPEKLAALPQKTLDELRELGMIDYDVYDVGKGMERHVRPLWIAHTTFYWKQTFPAHKAVVVEHRYEPSVGGSAQSIVGSDYADDASMKDFTERYCIDKAFLRAAKRLQRQSAASDNRMIVTEERLEYILKTGANWAVSIGEFHLSVDKGDPENLVSFCMDGVRKVSPTRFETTRKDFWPQRNLDILLLVPRRL